MINLLHSERMLRLEEFPELMLSNGCYILDAIKYLLYPKLSLPIRLVRNRCTLIDYISFLTIVTFI